MNAEGLALPKTADTDRSQQARARWVLLVLFLALLFVYVFDILLFLANREIVKNRLELDDIHFAHHSIGSVLRKREHDRKNVILHLGTSDVSGSPFPQNTAIADFMNDSLSNDFVYNLGQIQANALTILALTELLADTHPSMILIAVTPDLFPPDDWGSPIVNEHMDILSPLLPREVLSDLKQRENQQRNDVITNLNTKLGLSRLTTYHLDYFTWLRTRRNRLYGKIFQNVADKLRDVQLADSLAPLETSIQILLTAVERMKGRGSRVVAYFSPLTHEDQVYGRGKYIQFRKEMSQILSKHGVEMLDLSTLMPESNSFFLDYIHLRPRGNRMVAEALITTLKLQRKTP